MGRESGVEIMDVDIAETAAVRRWLGEQIVAEDWGKK